MPNASENSMDVLTNLLGERTRFETWLQQLDAKRASTPQHVFDRVRGDYQSRLAKVNEQLAGRAGDLQATVTDLAAKVAALFAEETQHRDERTEAELRGSVGELGDTDARDLISQCDAEISRLEGERASVGAELAKFQDILAQVTKAPAPAAAAPAAPAGQAAAPAAEGKGGKGAGFDDLAFLQTLSQPNSGGSGKRPEGSAGSAQPAEAARAEEAPAMAGARRAAQPAGGVREGSAESLSLTPGALPAFLKEVPTEQIKTLKCQECGTMNYPTEWYCERCGGELAAL
jgi:hypothetical protein